MSAVSLLARALASSVMNPLVSRENLPPTSTARNDQAGPCTSLQGTLGELVPCASWQPRVPRRLVHKRPLLGPPSPCKALTSVVSTATWAPPCNGRPSTTTSNLRASSSVAVGRSVPHKNICADSATCLSADSGSGTFQRKTSATEHPGTGTCCANGP